MDKRLFVRWGKSFVALDSIEAFGENEYRNQKNEDVYFCTTATDILFTSDKSEYDCLFNFFQLVEYIP